MNWSEWDFFVKAGSLLFCKLPSQSRRYCAVLLMTWFSRYGNPSVSCSSCSIDIIDIDRVTVGSAIR